MFGNFGGDAPVERFAGATVGPLDIRVQKDDSAGVDMHHQLFCCLTVAYLHALEDGPADMRTYLPRFRSGKLDEVEANVVTDCIYRVRILVRKDPDEERSEAGQFFFQGVCITCVRRRLAVLAQPARDSFRLT